jgi:hypothetical protein
MAESLPSKRFALVDVPEVTGFKAKFVYNFFVPDERENDSGLEAPEFIRARPASNFDSVFIDSINFRRFTSRFVEFDWETKADIGRTRNKSQPSIKDNFKKIHNEQTFTTDDYTNMLFQDTGQDQKLSFLIKRALEEIRDRQNPKKDESPLDIVRYLNHRTDRNVGPRFLAESFLKIKREGATFLDKDRREIVAEDLLSEISSVRVRAQLNNKVIEKLLKTTSQSTLNIFDDETDSMLKQAREIQEQAISQKNSSILDGSDYDFEILDFIGVRTIDPSVFDSTAQVIGYVIDKEEHIPESGPIAHEPIVVESAFANKTIDIKIRYGSTYSYSIRAIAVIEIQVEDTDSDDILGISFLVSSKPSEKQVVTTEEFVPPPVPADFNISFDFQADAPRLMWNFPVNTQRDVKQFQIFRRLSISDPFELIKQFDFDDSTVLSEPRETPDEELVELLDSPKNFYLDKEFTRDSVFIYAVCAIDAHGFSSNYSTQFEISFDRFRNRLVKTVISLSEAPKAYPNAFLLRDTFVDTIRDSGHKKVKVIFNPEFLQVLDSKDNDLRVLKSDNDSKYRLQLINTDLQEQQVVDITLKDRRTTTEKNEEE